MNANISKRFMKKFPDSFLQQTAVKQKESVYVFDMYVCLYVCQCVSSYLLQGGTDFDECFVIKFVVIALMYCVLGIIKL